MKTNKAVVVALAAAILASGGGLAGSLATATPAQAATQRVTTEAAAPALSMFAYGVSGNSGNAVWSAPTNISGKVTSYTITVKKTGKADLVFTNTSKEKDITMTLTGLSQNTIYTVIVKANVVSPTGVKSSVSASSLMHTPYALTSVMPVAPKVAVSHVTNNSLTAVWSQPIHLAGWADNYTVVVKQGTKVVQSIIVPDWSRNTFYTNTLNISGLAANTAYTMEVTTNSRAFEGTKTASSKATVVKFTTAAKASSVAVAKPSVTVSTVTSSSAVVNWKKPAVTKGAIASYGITLTDRSTGKKYFFSRSADSDNFKLSPLEAGKAYTVYVVAKAVSADGKSASYSVTQANFTTKTK